MTSRIDVQMMRRALALAERGRGHTSPNPPVGAVLARDGQIVGEGWHRRAGEPHAEIEAMRIAGDHARGATLYVTLEPCTIEGRTPACAPAVIDAGIARVVIGTTDPNPRVDGAGAHALREAGLDVESGVLDLDARRMIEAFAKHVRTGRAFLTAKTAVTLDGRAAAADGSSQWITGPEARLDTHRLRAISQAVVIGAGTA
ncbi:MAG: bifunctional diaminohydroxyphosphoribosylaminopyrimidine deaminase/5-amino-6-(5-phosphoribosylamino)uracil reductase RibD, partial [Actinomycetota bacterium]